MRFREHLLVMPSPTNSQIHFYDIEVLVFDFDGVIIDSVMAKGLAFQKLYAPFGKVISEKVFSHHLKAGGISRFDKIRYYHREFLGQKLTDTEVETWAQNYSAVVEDLVLSAPLVLGALQFFKKWRNQKRMFIASATPQNELQHILKRLELFQYFESAWGYPTEKTSALSQVLKITQRNQDQVVMVGDSISDYEASLALKVRFIGRRTPLVKFDPLCTTIDNFHELDRILDSRS